LLESIGILSCLDRLLDPRRRSCSGLRDRLHRPLRERLALKPHESITCLLPQPFLPGAPRPRIVQGTRWLTDVPLPDPWSEFATARPRWAFLFQQRGLAGSRLDP
jgi:hypothetical protein